jgi:uncharacterized membrane protein
MSSTSNVVPQQSTVTISSMRVGCQSINLFQNATFIVDLFNSDGGRVERQIITISNEEYLAWNNNDEYIMNLIATKLGFILQP